MIRTCFSVLFLLIAQSAFSWGSRGHKIVAEIAQSRLEQKIVDSVNRYLDVDSWEEAACWMDEMHDDRAYDFMRPWHYVDIPKDKTYVETKSPNLVNELDFVIGALKNRRKYPREKTGMYLKILMHLMGDLHQPLHCGYAHDKGGNDVIVEYTGELMNLHRVWDSAIINEKQLSAYECVKVMKSWTPEQIAKIKQASITECVSECRALLPKVYELKGKVNGKYTMACVPVIREQLAKASLRLEAQLTEIFAR